MISVAVYPNITKSGAADILERIIKFSSNHNMKILLPTKEGRFFHHEELIKEDIERGKIDMAMSIGGDGTLLGLCRDVAQNGVPVCGVNIGHLGFLTDIEPNELEAKLLKIVNKEYKIEKRLMLSAFIERDNVLNYVGSALNDIVVSKCGVSRMLHFNLQINDYLVTSYKADGLIISTPTGSTAYSLSAGGPIVNPKVKGIIVTPICPHACYIRPMVIDESEVVKLDIKNMISMNKRNVNLTLDGQVSFDIEPNDTIVVAKAQFPAKIIRFEDKNFYQTFMHKLCL